MTKTAEIAALDRFIAQLGPHSYLGPWLRDNREAIVADITGDLPVELLLPNAAHKLAADLIQAGRAEADRIVTIAKAQADGQKAQTQTHCDNQRRLVAGLIERAASEAVRVLGR